MVPIVLPYFYDKMAMASLIGQTVGFYANEKL